MPDRRLRRFSPMTPDERARAAEITPEDRERAAETFRRDTLPGFAGLLDAEADAPEPPPKTKPTRPRGGRRR